MQDNDEICLCFHVTKRSLEKFIRLEKPVRDSQLSECYGAGTGCGWCRPFLKAIYAKANCTPSGDSPQQQNADIDALSPEQYASARTDYRQKLKSERED